MKSRKERLKIPEENSLSLMEIWDMMNTFDGINKTLNNKLFKL